MVEKRFPEGALFEVGSEDEGQHAAVRRVINLQSGALYGFAAIVGLVTIVAGVLTVARHVGS
jgi:hypothetical protein